MYATGTSSIDIEEVTAAIAINAKNVNATNTPTPPIVSNKAGNTLKISESP
eukprot:CAMPEP_0182946670 /NCGR_PEP_ID=MMETSP0105_2-20130417/57393_1 /TAXON_ID=81532 ORGANISM="Acanthoeca-like sp., Strain 10tr" /NCGR_SAMPLE_ID=MMETSP0105_2 /ASSEMBLY_ACC=CAM_ASM_000205 /LENGTH=50 /DNA_ID=CAMNT_0025086817 /DNA_START=313 /DNA_END=465 /DNA_ORIENTATION=-